MRAIALRIAYVALSVLCVSPNGALGESYPSRPIRFVVPYPAGGAAMDMRARIGADKLSHSLRQQAIIKSPKLYLADTGLLCALLNIRSEEALRQSPSAGAVWETFVFAQLRHRERRAGRAGSLFFWRDRTREMDFVTEMGGRLELFEAKWTELPAATDVANLSFVREAVGRSRIARGVVVCRARNGFPLPGGFRALPIAELG